MNVLTKICKNCEIDKPTDSFWKNARNKDGKESRCVDCTKSFLSTKKESVKESQRKWREKNPDYMKKYGQLESNKEYHREYYAEHKSEYIQRKQDWRKENPERETEARQIYVSKNRETLNEYHRKWKANKRETDSSFKIKSNISRRIRYELNTLLKGKKTKRTTELLGCSIEELKSYIELKFIDNMSWDNYGSIWEIDHIIPCASWDFSKAFENKCCWNYRNLQPLIKDKNRSKGSRYTNDDKDNYISQMLLIFKD